MKELKEELIKEIERQHKGQFKGYVIFDRYEAEILHKVLKFKEPIKQDCECKFDGKCAIKPSKFSHCPEECEIYEPIKQEGIECEYCYEIDCKCLDEKCLNCGKETIREKGHTLCYKCNDLF